MAAVLSLEPRFLEPNPAPRLRLVVQPVSQPVSSCRQPDPRPARRHRPAVYHRRRVLAALAGLALALTVARAGAALGGSSLASAERLPHVQHVVVQPGDSLWAIAQRVAPGHDPRGIVDVLTRQVGSGPLVPGMTLVVPAP